MCVAPGASETVSQGPAGRRLAVPPCPRAPLSHQPPATLPPPPPPPGRRLCVPARGRQGRGRQWQGRHGVWAHPRHGGPQDPGGDGEDEEGDGRHRLSRPQGPNRCQGNRAAHGTGAPHGRATGHCQLILSAVRPRWPPGCRPPTQRSLPAPPSRLTTPVDTRPLLCSPRPHHSTRLDLLWELHRISLVFTPPSRAAEACIHACRPDACSTTASRFPLCTHRPVEPCYAVAPAHPVLLHPSLTCFPLCLSPFSLSPPAGLCLRPTAAL